MSEPCHALVFRDVREQLCLRTASEAVCEDLAVFQESQNKEHLVSALLRVGEMECGLADAFEDAFPLFTDSLSWALASPAHAKALAGATQHTLRARPYQSTQYVSRPEGFAYYGLHPLDYADAVKTMPGFGVGPVIVIGIRTIGFTLGALVAAALRVRIDGTRVRSMSVRPSGHPYDRVCSFTEKQIKAITEDIENLSAIVVDEGPGLSGSSFLSVGDALVVLGVQPPQITFMCSRDVNCADLMAPNAAERWQRFKTHIVERKHLKPEEDAVLLPAGEWRNSIADEREWPGLWTTMRPMAYRRARGSDVFEYYGLGRYGQEVRERGNRLADFGFLSKATPADNGFSRAKSASGRRLTKNDLSEHVLGRMAEYLALRARFFEARSVPPTAEFERMVRFNFKQATNRELPTDFRLPSRRVVISDSQMMPYQWLQPDDGRQFTKIDAVLDGDNHFFPGPVDRAWDVAGAVIEWEMDGHSQQYFVRRYAEFASDDVSAELPAYMVAYCAFRNGYCRMAASAMEAIDESESRRLARDASRYADALATLTKREVAVAAYE